jgi:gliding motility-associated-like protein
MKSENSYPGSKFNTFGVYIHNANDKERKNIFTAAPFALLLFVLLIIPNKAQCQQAQDCFNAITVCSNTYQQNIASTGLGTMQEIPSGTTCISNGETNSTWYMFRIEVGGSLMFQLNPLNAQDDYDYILYNITNHNCTDIMNGGVQPLRCNYSSATGNTGLASAATNTTSNAAGSNQCASITTAKDDIYALMVNNFTATNSGYGLNFSGTTVIYDAQPPAFTSAQSTTCSPDRVILNFSERIKCTSIASDGSDFTVSGPSSVVVTAAIGIGCNSTLLASEVRIYFSSPVTVQGTYTVHINQGSDGTTVSDFCDNMISTGAPETFTVLYNAPSATIVSRINETCTTLGSATGDASGGTSPYTYLWNTSPVQTTLTANNLSAGSHNFTVTDANGCTALIAAHILPVGLPVLTFTKFDVRCDLLFSGEATVHVTGGVAPYSYRWNTSPPQTTATAVGLEAGNYIVSVSTADGCTITESISIPIIGLPAVSITQQNVACNGLSLGTATVTATGTAPFTYEWNTSPPQFTLQISALAAGEYSVTVTDSVGCMIDVVVNIISGGMLLNTSAVALTCATAHTGQATVIASNGTPPYSYLWNTIPPQNTSTASMLAGGTYTVIVNDAGGCTGSATVTVVSPPIISININSNNADCSLNNGLAMATVVGGYAPYIYSWATYPIQTNSFASNLAAGIYSLTVTDATGCMALERAYIGNFNGPQGFITDVVNATCNRANGSAAVTEVTGNAPFTYLWNTIPQQYNSVGTGLGENTYFAMITDAGGCVSFLHVKINNSEVAAISFVSSTNASCSGNDGAATVSAQGGPTPYQYEWNTFPVQHSSSANHLGGGNYFVTLTDGNGCKDTMTINISENKAHNDFNFSIACFNSPVHFEGLTSYTGNALWTYDFGDSSTSNANSSTYAEHIFNGTGNYQVTLYINGGCATDTLYKPVKGSYKPDASFILKNEEAYANSPVQFIYTGSAVNIYSWNFGDGEWSAYNSPIHVFKTPEDSMNVLLYVTDKYGCADTSSIKIYVNVPPSVFLPNSFTPNGDGLNDAFKIPSHGISECSLQIFNRWGELVFSSDNLSQLNNEGWNGNVKGQQANDGSYPYTLTAKLADGNTVYHNGTINLLK